MPAEPSVSIVLTNYNHGRYLHTSLAAICGQTRPADEIIVIDDGSTDDSLEIIQRFAAVTPQMKLLRNDQNRGVPFSIARALKSVRCSHLVWAAADDRLSPKFLARSLAGLAKHPKAGLVFSQPAIFDDRTGAVTEHLGERDNGIASFVGDEPQFFGPQQLTERLQRGYLWISGNTVIVRRACLREVGDFIADLQWHSDWFAFYAVALRYGAVGIPETLAMIRMRPDTYSRSGMNDRARQTAVIHALFDVLRQPGFEDLRKRFRALPAILSALGEAPLRALARRPRDWDLYWRYAGWQAGRRREKLRQRLAMPLPAGRRLKLKLRYQLACWLGSAIVLSTPSRWTRADPA